VERDGKGRRGRCETLVADLLGPAVTGPIPSDGHENAGRIEVGPRILLICFVCFWEVLSAGTAFLRGTRCEMTLHMNN
jgi:hypothetical protein